MHDAQILTQPDSVRQWWTFVGYAGNIALGLLEGTVRNNFLPCFLLQRAKSGSCGN